MEARLGLSASSIENARLNLPSPGNVVRIGMAGNRPVPCKKNCNETARRSGTSPITSPMSSNSNRGQLTNSCGSDLRETYNAL